MSLLMGMRVRMRVGLVRGSDVPRTMRCIWQVAGLWPSATRLACVLQSVLDGAHHRAILWRIYALQNPLNPMRLPAVRLVLPAVQAGQARKTLTMGLAYNPLVLYCHALV